MQREDLLQKTMAPELPVKYVVTDDETIAHHRAYQACVRASEKLKAAGTGAVAELTPQGETLILTTWGGDLTIASYNGVNIRTPVDPEDAVVAIEHFDGQDADAFNEFAEKVERWVAEGDITYVDPSFLPVDLHPDATEHSP